MVSERFTKPRKALAIQAKLARELRAKLKLYDELKRQTSNISDTHVREWIGELEVLLHREAYILTEIDQLNNRSSKTDRLAFNHFKYGMQTDMLNNESRELAAIGVLKKTFGWVFGMKLDKKIKAKIRELLDAYKKYSKREYREHRQLIKTLQYA